MTRWLLLALVAGCSPEIADTTSLVAGPRLLAVAASPAEVRPGQPFMLRALDVGPAGAAGRPLEWSLCTERTPLTEPGPLASACLADAALPGLGTGDEAQGTVPRDVCRTFGPDQPAPKPGQPSGRPADPDPTGGYYQPVRVRVAGGDSAFGLRVLCNLGGATPMQQADFDAAYFPNHNPALAGLFLETGARLVSLEEDPTAVTIVPRSTRLALRAAWTACPARVAEGCAGAEPYAWLDPTWRQLIQRREAIRISWFTTGGAFDAARTGRAEAEAGTALDSSNVWASPPSAGPVLLWVVIRDDRGGLGWSSYRLTTQ